MDGISREIDQLANWMENVTSVLFITGAGISADSGLPTYRGVGGLYNSQHTEDGISIEQALSGPMLRRRPEITWKYLWQIADSARGKTFNRAHQVIAKIEQRLPRVWVLTQNIDGFHLSAGSRNVIEIHGNMSRLSCLDCGHEFLSSELSTFDTPPRCRKCTGVLRPSVVLFEEMLPSAAIETLRRELVNPFDLVVSVGTSSVFPYIVEPVYLAARQGIPSVEINPADETDISRVVDLHIRARAAEAFDLLARRLDLN